jgi:tetratricopeptide (TPR) repeat protein
LFFKSILYFLAAFLLTSYVIEGMVRFFTPQKITPSIISSAFGVQNGLKKDIKVIRNHMDSFSYQVITNSKHLRSSREISYKKDEGVFRILCLGDSILFGYGVNNQETFSNYLEEALNKRTKNIHYEVINASAPGWGPVEYLLFLQNEGYKYQPDIIITTNFTDDFDGQSSHRVVFEKIHFGKNGEREKVFLDGFHLEHLNSDWQSFILNGIFRSRIYEELSLSSHLLSLLRNKTNQLFAVKLNDQSRSFVAQWITSHGLENKQNFEWVLPQRKFSSGQIKQILNQWGKIDNDQSLLEKTGYLLEYYSVLDEISHWAQFQKVPWLTLNLPVFQEVLKLKNETSIDYLSNEKYFYSLNLLSDFIRYQENTSELLFFPGDNHWTPAGHKLVALLVEHYLVGKRLIKNDIPLQVKGEFIVGAQAKIIEANRKISPQLSDYPKSFFIQAVILKNMGLEVKALQMFEEYMKYFPDDFETYFQIGLLSFNKRVYDDAIRYLELAATPNSKTQARALVKLVEVYLAQKDFDNALQVLTRAEKLGGSFTSEIYNKMGQVLLAKRQTQKAEYYFQLAISHRPEFSGYRINYGNFLILAKRYQEAVDQFKLALINNPEWILALEGLGGAYWKLGDQERAIACFKEILRLDQSNKMALETLKFLQKSSASLINNF